MPRVLNAAEYREKMVANGLGTDFGADTDWIKAISRNPVSHTHNVSIAGGTKDVNYRASVSYRNVQGIAKSPTSTRFPDASQQTRRLSKAS